MPRGCRQDDRALATRLMDPRQFRQRRRGQGQYRLDPRRRNGAQAMGLLAPVHAVVHDASGKSIVIEYVDGKLNVYDNPLGVITNSPGFDWHMTNLRNYVNFSFNNHPPIQLGSVKLEPFGQGSGMLGMPGDFTPPSRFVRAVAFSQSVLQPKTGDDAVLTAFHILNNFDIPKRFGAGGGEGRPRQRPRRLHDLDGRERSQGEAVLLPHLRGQPHPHDRPHENESRRQGHRHLLDAWRGDVSALKSVEPNRLTAFDQGGYSGRRIATLTSYRHFGQTAKGP